MRAPSAIRTTRHSRTSSYSVAVGATVIKPMYPEGERIADYQDYIQQFLARLR